MRRRANEVLLERVRADGDESSAHALLQAFFSGFPVERLRVVLNSANEEAVRAGVWLASELGTRAAPLVADLAILLNHPSRYVRFFAVDGLLTGASYWAKRVGATRTGPDGFDGARATEKRVHPLGIGCCPPTIHFENCTSTHLYTTDRKLRQVFFQLDTTPTPPSSPNN